MKQFVYSIFDRKALYYLPLFLCRTDDEARRSFGEAMTSDTPIAKYPGDFDLCLLGYLDLETGVLSPSGPSLVWDGASCFEAIHAQRRRYNGAALGAEEIPSSLSSEDVVLSS